MNRIVPKLWGREEWLILTEFYVVKKLIIKEGHNISLQYHKEKDEFWYVIEGVGMAFVNGKRIDLKKNDYIHLPPGEIHTVSSVRGNLIIMETSTPQVDDVVRISRKVDLRCL